MARVLRQNQAQVKETLSRLRDLLCDHEEVIVFYSTTYDQGYLSVTDACVDFIENRSGAKNTRIRTSFLNQLLILN